MNKKITLTLLLCFIALSSLMAQEKRNCGTMEYLQQKVQENPSILLRMQEIEQFTQEKIKNKNQQRLDGSVYTIPVVVHVLYTNNQNNISDAQILSQIDVLNEDFRRLNSDADNTWSQAADIEVEFCMASIDPNNNATNGITRTQVTRSSWIVDDKMKKSSTGGVNAWNTTQYLNMWIVPEILDDGFTVLGYAQFPGGDVTTDGVVIGYEYFGNTGTVSPPFNLGRTTTHEVGHFFNLKHIWGEPPFASSNGCNFDDNVSDTPNAAGPNYGCSVGHVSCSSVDMVQNYMDYSDDSCMNLFTSGQKDRIRAILAAGGSRRSLALSDKCSGSTTQPTCNDGIQNGNETGVDCGGSCAPCQTSSCTGQISTFPYSESFESGLGLWTQDTSDNLNWTRDSNGTPSGSTGPSSGADGSFYMYTEASTSGTGFPNKRAILNSPCFDLTGATQANFSFSYHMYGADMGSLTLEASTNNGSTWTSLWTQTGNKGNSWLTQSVNLSAYLGENVKLRFNGVTGTNYRSDMAIDKISLTTGTIVTPPSCSNIRLSIKFDNYPEETRWEILNSSNSVVSSGGTYDNQADGSTLNLTGCLDTGCYTLVFYDSFGDGMCCQYGSGSYTLTNTDTNEVLVTGGSFNSSQSTSFCLGGATGRQDTVEVVARRSVEDSFDVKIYPNPAKGNLLNISLKASKASYRISNMLGQEVAKGEIVGKTIDISELNRGNYLINIITADGKSVTKQLVRE